MFPGNGRPDYYGFLAYAEFSRIVSARVQPYIIAGIFQEIIHSAHGIAIHINECNEPRQHMVGKRPQLLRRPYRERKKRIFFLHSRNYLLNWPLIQFERLLDERIPPSSSAV